MNIRTFKPGDDAQQVSIYNEAASGLPRFKPATLDEVRRRCAAPDFDPDMRLYLEIDRRLVGYVVCQPNGRVSYPWCRKGYEGHADALFTALLERMRQRGLNKPFAAYRSDWTGQRDFFARHQFAQTREMVNFLLDMTDMPTPAARFSTITSLSPADIPAVLRLGAGVLKTNDPIALEQELLHNRWFSPDSLFVLRSKPEEPPLAIGLVISNPDYADPHQLDASMPCFRLGAFGTEGMTSKRVNGMFSFLTNDDRGLIPLALDLMSWAAVRLQDDDVGALAAQVPSDAHLYRFYKQHFRRQGSFPIYERDLSSLS